MADHSRSLTLNPPAKLNRFLHIVGRRADGYHLLQTAFEIIDWCDELELAVRVDRQIVRHGGAADVPDEQDLIVRAARALQAASGTALGADLTLVKSIPQGAGLGGGSSDAAATLLGLNQLWGLHQSPMELARIGLRLGADVPVFIHQQPAWAEGVGEKLSPLPFKQRDYLVVFPGVQLPTPLMFADPRLARDCLPVTRDDYLAGATLSNVFEPVAFMLSPEIAAAAHWLVERIGPARMTGSGSALYVEIENRACVNAAMADAPANWTWRCASSLANWFDKPPGRPRK